MSRGEEILPFADDVVRAVAGPSSRHAALIESAFDVLVETPGGGVRVTGEATGRGAARRVIDRLAERVKLGAEVGESDVRAAIGAVRSGGGSWAAGAALPVGRRGGVVAPKTDAQARYLETLQKKSLVFGVGPAGTGKTFLAVAYGASLLASGEVSRLIITRPAVEAGERLGFLPGDLTEKVDPYMAPIWDALRDLMGAAEVERLRDPAQREGAKRERRAVEVAPIAFMRGRTLNNAFVIVDEAQNCTRNQMKMVLTRLGEGARMAVTGDPSQVDLPHSADSGLAHAVGLLEGVEDVGVCRFAASDVVRHPLVERIVKAYDAEAAGGLPRR